MFCDADDMFLTNLALYTIFSYIKRGFDTLICDFVEEVWITSQGVMDYYTHHRDDKYVHGKVYRRRHLVDDHISWFTDIQANEDFAYNVLAIKTSRSIEYHATPIYLWHWRDTSICRADPLYALKTYPDMITANEHLVK
jgi:hypothetical protein